MPQVPPTNIRNVALVGHGGSGKTTLAEALLHSAGCISRVGRVEDGSTVSDFEPEEQRHRISVSVALVPFEWQGHHINILDCPGYADFASGQVQLDTISSGGGQIAFPVPEPGTAFLMPAGLLLFAFALRRRFA